MNQNLFGLCADPKKKHLREDSLVPLISLPGVSPALDKPAFYWPIIFIRISGFFPKQV